MTTETGVDRRAVVRGVVAGAFVIVVVAAIGAVLDRSIDDFDDSGWPFLLFLAILFAYATAGFGAGKLAPSAPLSNGALAGVGAFAVWIPARIVIWAIRDDAGGLLSGDEPVLTVGGVFANLVFATALGMLGGMLAARRSPDASADTR
ncbi:MAG: hypothetical protein ACRDY4_14695 [Acidimicrobiia bacterium]